MEFEELLKSLDNLLSIDSQAERSEILSPVIDSIKSINATLIDTTAALEAANNEIAKLEKENRRLFLQITDDSDEANKTVVEDQLEIDDLFNEDGTIKRGE